MKSFSIILFITTCALATHAQKTADEVIAKVIQAKGGMDKLKAIQTLKMQGIIEFGGGGIKVPLNLYFIHDKIFKQEFTFNGLTGYSIQARDTGWNFSPFNGMTSPERATPEDLKQGLNDLDIQSNFIDYASKGYSIELMEPEDVDGVDAIQLKLNVLPNKTVFYYIDPETWYIIRTKVKGISNGQEYTNISNYYNFKATSAGVVYPYTVDNVTYENIDVNAPIDPATFSIAKKK